MIIKMVHRLACYFQETNYDWVGHWVHFASYMFPPEKNRSDWKIRMIMDFSNDLISYAHNKLKNAINFYGYALD
jgi:hypothetical protein